MTGTPTGETANSGDSKTTENPTATPVVNAVDTAEVERLKKEAEQARMRANQLQNQIDEAKKAEEARKAKELEEQNEFKSLYEQEKAKREEYETQKEREARLAAIESASNEVLADYPDAVKEIAKETGIAPTDATDEAKAEFKKRLESINAKLPQVTVGANNPSNPTPTTNPLSGDDMKIALKNENNFHELASKLPGVNAMLTKRP
jgi:uncharacterized phage infection (PIP) family protein YhgE